MYQEIILDHYKAKHHSGLREPYQAQVTHVNPTCGDEVMLRVALDGDRVTDVSYEGRGCSISQASASMLADLVAEVGLSRTETVALIEGFREALRSRGQLELDEDVYGDAAALSGVSKFSARVKCAMLAWVALEDAIAKA